MMKIRKMICLFVLFSVAFGFVIFSRSQTVSAQQSQLATTSGRRVFLPLLKTNKYSGFNAAEKFIGIYMMEYWTNSTVSKMTTADSLAGKKHSVSGWFIDIQDTHFVNPPSDITVNNLYRQLEALWQKGYVSFVNINSVTTSYSIASGKLDTYISRMADVYASWVRLGGGRRAFLAPLPEMNGVNSNGTPWASYGGDPANFKLAYNHIKAIFSQKGITKDQAWWVFAPNGWSIQGQEFEKYYPGDGSVDVIGFSSYNYGYCQIAYPWQRWENFDTLYKPYLVRMASMAPSKPIILTQTGSTAQTQASNTDINAKNTWLRVNYEYLSKEPQVLGILYYDYDQSSWECNWKITSGGNYSGYHDGASYASYSYLSSSKLQSIIP